MKPPAKFAKLMICLVSLGLGACELFETPTPSPSKAVAELLKPVPVYAKAPCWMQKEWSRDNSRKKTAETGTVTAYAPPCVTDKKPAPKPQTSEPKSS